MTYLQLLFFSVVHSFTFSFCLSGFRPFFRAFFLSVLPSLFCSSCFFRFFLFLLPSVLFFFFFFSGYVQLYFHSFFKIFIIPVLIPFSCVRARVYMYVCVRARARVCVCVCVCVLFRFVDLILFYHGEKSNESVTMRLLDSAKKATNRRQTTKRILSRNWREVKWIHESMGRGGGGAGERIPREEREREGERGRVREREGARERELVNGALHLKTFAQNN